MISLKPDLQMHEEELVGVKKFPDSEFVRHYQRTGVQV